MVVTELVVMTGGMFTVTFAALEAYYYLYGKKTHEKKNEVQS